VVSLNLLMKSICRYHRHRRFLGRQSRPYSCKLQPPTESQSGKENVSKGTMQGQAITKVQPVDPGDVRRFNAAEQVRVQIDISETGRVTNVKAISGHPLLRDAAVEAARKWIFNPTTLDGVPVTKRIVLNFGLTVPD